MARGRLGVEPTHFLATGEEKEVKGQAQESLADLRSPRDHRRLTGGEDLRDDPAQKRRRGRGGFGGFQDHGVARGKGGDERPEGELDGIVPRGRDENDTKGLAADLAPGGEQVKRMADATGFCPPSQALPKEADFGDNKLDLSEIGLDPGFSKVGGKGFKDRLRIPDEDGLEALQDPEPRLHRPTRPGNEEIPCPVEHL